MENLKEKFIWFWVKIVHKLRCRFEAFLPESEVESKQKDILRSKAKLLAAAGKDIELTDEWQRYLAKFQKLLLFSDPRFFLNWDTIRASMFHEPNLLELRALQALPQWPQLKVALKECASGRPRPYPWLMSSSGNLIHHAYLLQEFLSNYKISVSDLKSVFEFGGGYASMCRLFYNLGFEGRYLIYDIPEFNLLQEYFLKNCRPGIDVSFNPEGVAPITLLDSPSNLAAYFSKNTPDLFLATWSLSEAPIDIREKVLNILPDSKYIFIIFRDVFSGIDHLKYFRSWQQAKPNYDWRLTEFGHMPHNFLLVGKIKSNPS